MTELYPGIHKIQLVGAGAYLLVDDEVTLVDTGHRGSSQRLLWELARIGKRPADIRRILLTHAHPDHAGGLTEIAPLTGATIHVHRAEAPLLAGEVDWPNPFQRRWLATAMGPLVSRMNPPPFPVDVLDDGDRLDILGGIRVLHTPGHTPGSVCYYVEQSRLVIAGDALEYKRNRLGEPNAFFTVDPAEARRSIERLAALPVEIMLLSHFPPLHRAQRRLWHLMGRWQRRSAI